jgi:hypothetical protein
MMLRGYRSADVGLLTGPWLDGELIGLPLAGWPPVAELTAVAPPAGPGDELCIAPGAGFARFAGLDWVHRRARLETGLQPGRDGKAAALLEAAVRYAFGTLNLHRLYGWVTPAATPASPAGSGPAAILEPAGFRREATVPDGIWLDGRPVEREIWGVIRHD